MASALFLDPSQPVFTAGGLLASGAKRFFYLTGTSTLTTVYSDAALTTAHTNPVIADAAGRFPEIFYDPAVVMRVKTTTSANVTIDDVDPYISDGYVQAGLFSALATASIAGVDLIRTSGWGATGKGAADYVYDAAVDAAFVTANPRWAVRDLAGRGFRLNDKQPLNFDMFGCYRNTVVNSAGVVLSGTDDLPAWLAMQAFQLEYSENADMFGIYNVAPRMDFAAGNYYYSDSLEVKDTVANYWGAAAPNGNHANTGTAFFFAGGKTGIRVQAYNTSLATATAGSGYSASGSFFAFITVHGQTGATAADGWMLRTRCTLFFCGAANFTRHGVRNYNDIGGATDTLGNGNGTHIIGGDYGTNGTPTHGGSGIYMRGGDGNACTVSKVNLTYNFNFGVEDLSFLGNYYDGNHAQTNGYAAAGARYATRTIGSGCHYLGNHYVIHINGSEAACSTEVPGAGANWRLVGAGVANSIYHQWVSGTQTWYKGGAYGTQGDNQLSTFIGCYAEGDQPASQGSTRTSWDNCFLAQGAIGGAIMTATNSVAVFNKIGASGTPITAGQFISVHWGSASITGDDAYGSLGNSDVGARNWSFHINSSDQIYALWLASGSSIPYSILPSTTVPGVSFPRGIAVRNINQYSGTVAPTTGTWDRGDIVWNETATTGSNGGWVCTVAGTPGTWVAFGITGAIQAVAQADSTAAALADLVTDFNALLAKLRTSKLIAT